MTSDMPPPPFTAPMDPAGYTRRVAQEPHQTIEPVTTQRDLFVLAHLGIPRVDAAGLDPVRCSSSASTGVHRAATIAGDAGKSAVLRFSC